jgi:copper transport protein
MTLRFLLRGGALCLLLCLSLFATRTPVAFAHAAFLGSTPEAGSRLQTTPPQIVLRFTESLNQALSKASLLNAQTGKPVATKKAASGKANELALRPDAPLPRAPYRVDWHSVSSDDGHALEGSYGFGVRTAPLGGARAVEQSPLARNGWIRIWLRTLFYAALFFFAGGVLNGMLLSRKAPGTWLVPAVVRERPGSGIDRGQALAARAWSRTLDAGWLAAGAAAAATLVDTADANGHLSLAGIHDYLLTNTAGLARVGTVVALAMAALLMRRMLVASAAWILIAFMTIALSGHANSAAPRLGAVISDWTHLIAAAVWIGGIAQIAVTWLPQMSAAGRSLRSAVMRGVLDRFGKVALPAFLIVAVSGLVNALIELGGVSALWQAPYGRVLAVKIGLVGVIALASYFHALRLRPRLLSANPHPPEVLERRHWRLLSLEPLIAVAVVGAASALVAFPLPPRQLRAADEARAASPNCNPCPLPIPRTDELSVAEQAGSNIAAFWLRRDGDRLSGTVRLLDDNGHPADAPIRLLGGELAPCGPACWRFSVSGAGPVITVVETEGAKSYRASVPTVWQPKANRRARVLVRQAERTMRGLSTLVEDERLTSGPGTFVRTLYRLQAPNRFTYRTSAGAASVVIAKRQWDHVGQGPWQAGEFGGLTAFRTKDFFRWTPYARSTRLLGVREVGGKRAAEVALMDPGTPIWFRLVIDLQTKRVLRDRMVTEAHFMSREYRDFNAPLAIRPPAHSIGGP